jgi:hypothetical protein
LREGGRELAIQPASLLCNKGKKVGKRGGQTVIFFSLSPHASDDPSPPNDDG